MFLPCKYQCKQNFLQKFRLVVRKLLQENLNIVTFAARAGKVSAHPAYGTVFVWAKCADGEDVFITYPARPEFVGLENRGRYTLPELQQILTKMAMES